MAQQLPRSWMMCVLSKVGGGSGGGGGRVMSMQGFSNYTVVRAVGAATHNHRHFVTSPRSQALLIFSRPATSSSSSAHRNVRLAGVSSGRYRAGIGKNCADDFVVCGRGMRISRLPLLSPFFPRSLSSAEAQAVADGIVKESLEKEAEERDEAETSLAAAVVEEEEAGSSLLTEMGVIVKDEAGGSLDDVLSAVVVEKETDEVRERHRLVAEIRTKELELAELRIALGEVDEKQGVEVESGVGTEFPEVDVSAEQAAVSPVSAALQESDHDDYGMTHAESEQSGGVATTKIKDAGSECVAHPWLEWIQFLKRLDHGGYFVDEENTVVDMNGRTSDDVGLIKRACLNFARERDDIFLHYSRKNLEVMARFGCPSTDRKVVNAGKRLRDFLAVDEVSVCKPCALRSSCERRDFKANADHVAGTPEVVRLLSQYALEVSPYAKEGLQIPIAVQTACQNLLKETVALGAVPRDPSLPEVEREGATSVTSGDRRGVRRERESKRKTRDADIEMKPGDWKCEGCQYVNFARNRTCRECDAYRPVPEMRPGDWRCPECNFLNFSRNQQCHDCQVDRPVDARSRSSYDVGSRYERGAPQDRGSNFGERGSRFDRDRRSEVSRGGERDSYGRSRDIGGVERKSGSDDSRSGRRSNYEEWRPDFKTRGDFDKDDRKDRRSAQDRRSALDIVDDSDEDGLDDFELDSDADDISDVEPLGDEEFQDMRPAASASRGKADTGKNDELWSRGVGRRNEGKDSWWEDDRDFRSESKDRGSRNGGVTSRVRGGGRGGGRGDFGRGRSSSRDSRTSSYEPSDRDSGRFYGRSDRDFDGLSRGRAGGRGGGRGVRGGRGGRGGRGRGRR